MREEGLYGYKELFPQLDPTAYLAPGARLVGDVRLAAGASVWWNAVLRGDLQPVILGARTNVQDNAVLHVGHHEACVIGDDVLIGHGAICHGCRIENGAVIGMGAIILSGAVIGAEALIAAGSVVGERTSVPPQTLWAGNPGRVIKKIGPAVLARMREGSEFYHGLAQLYSKQDD